MSYMFYYKIICKIRIIIGFVFIYFFSLNLSAQRISKARSSYSYINIIADTVKPVLLLNNTYPFLEETSNYHVLSGKIFDNKQLQEILIDGKNIGYLRNGDFSTQVDLIPGANIFNIQVFDYTGNKIEREIIIDYIPKGVPFVTLFRTYPYIETDNNIHTINGKITNSYRVDKLTINNEEINFTFFGNFSFPVKLVENQNRFTIVLYDFSGNVIAKEITIEYMKVIKK